MQEIRRLLLLLILNFPLHDYWVYLHDRNPFLMHTATEVEIEMPLFLIHNCNRDWKAIVCILLLKLRLNCHFSSLTIVTEIEKLLCIELQLPLKLKIKISITMTVTNIENLIEHLLKLIEIEIQCQIIEPAIATAFDILPNCNWCWYWTEYFRYCVSLESHFYIW